jgi:choline dehydrogenase-like flavoprotein
MQGRRVEFVIAGSGAGGATLANELAKRGKDILVVEKGKYEHKFGTLRFNGHENVLVLMTGHSTLISRG